MISNVWTISGTRLAHLLIVAVLLLTLPLAVGAACGGEDDDRESSRDREARGEGEQGESDDEDRDSSRSETSRDSDSSSRRSGDGVSVQDLEFVPNLEFTDLVMIDAATYFSGDLPAEIEAKVDEYYERNWDRYGDPLTIDESEGSVISEDDADAVIVMIHDDYDVAVAVLGSYDREAVRAALNASDLHEAYGREELGYIRWRYANSGSNSVILAMDQIYIDRGVEGFLQALSQQDTLLSNAGNPMVRAMERAGPGWLLLGLEGEEYCDELRVEFEEENCLSMAFAASTRNSSTIEATWVTLLNSEENAEQLLQAMEDRIKVAEYLPAIFELSWISRMETDGEFIVVTGTFTPEEAVEFMDKLW